MAEFLIVGCGDLGIKVARLLADEGNGVWGARRNPGALPSFIQPLGVDITQPFSLSNSLPRFRAMVFSAASPSSSEADYRATYVAGIQNLLVAVANSGQSPQKIVFTSSTGVYGQKTGEWVEETSPTLPSAFTGKAMCAAESALRQGQWPSVSLRLGGIYGPGRRSLVNRVENRTATLYDGDSVATNRIHEDDAARAIVHLLKLESPPPIVNGVDDFPADHNEVILWLAHRLGVEPANLPRQKASEASRGGNKRCRNLRLKSTGFTFRYPSFREGYSAFVSAVAAGA